MTAPSKRISLLTSSVESVVMQGIWLVTVLTDNVEPIGATVPKVPDPVVLLPAALEEEMLLTVNMR